MTMKKGLMLSALTLIGGSSASANVCTSWDPCCSPYGLNPPITRPSCDCNWTGSLDYLYWKPFIENNAAAQVLHTENFITTVNGGVPSTSTTSTSATTIQKDFNYDWDSGFRVALGYGIPCDKWGINLSWTHYRTDAFFSDSGFFNKKPSINSTFFVSGRMPFPGNYSLSGNSGRLNNPLGLATGSLTAKWDFQYNVIDLDFYREFYVGCSFSIKPYAGLRSLLIRNGSRTSANYSDPVFSTASTHLQGRQIDQTLRSDFKSFGLKAGLGSFFEWMCGFGIYGDFDIALLYGQNDVNSKIFDNYDSVQSSTLISTDYNTETPYKYHSLRFMSDLAIGLEWRTLVFCDQSAFFLKAGWEHHHIVGGSRFQTVQQAIGTRVHYGNGDISLYGFVFSIGLAI